MMVLTIVSMAFYIVMFKDLDNIDTTIASVFIDLTTIYIFAGILISTRRIKELKAQQIPAQTQE